MAIQSLDDARAITVLTSNGGSWQPNPNFWVGSKNSKIYQVDIVLKRRLRGTRCKCLWIALMQVGCAIRRWKKTVKMVQIQFWWFFEFLAHKIKQFLNFAPVISNIVMKDCNFWKTDSVKYLRSSKTPILGIFLGGYQFYAILTHKT